MGAEESAGPNESRKFTDKIMTRARRLASQVSLNNNETESLAYKDLRQKLVNQAAMTEEERKVGKN